MLTGEERKKEREREESSQRAAKKRLTTISAIMKYDSDSVLSIVAWMLSMGTRENYYASRCRFPIECNIAQDEMCVDKKIFFFSFKFISNL